MYVNLALNQVVLVDFQVIMNTSHGIRMSRRDNRVLLLKQSGTVGPRERGGESGVRVGGVGVQVVVVVVVVVLVVVVEWVSKKISISVIMMSAPAPLIAR